MNAQGVDDGFTLQPSLAIELPVGAPSSVVLAARDLARDLGKVFGTPAPAVVAADGSEQRIGIKVALPGPVEVPSPGPESFTVTVERAGAKPAIVVRGQDWRGCIYGLYEISHGLLGISPFWYWMDHKPRVSATITVPWNWKVEASTPTVRWRGWFPNDTAMLAPWLAQDSNRIDRMVETMLRLRLNFMDVGQINDIPAPDKGLILARACRDHGVAVTFTHTAPLSAHLKNWKGYWTNVRKMDPPPPIEISRVDRFREFYQYYIDLARREKLEVLQTMGFRGAGDIAFWGVTPEEMKRNPHVYWDTTSMPIDSPSTNEGKAATIESFMHQQYDMVRAAYGAAEAPPIRFTMYNENTDFFRDGLLMPPSGPKTIWTFVAARVDHYPEASLQDPRIRADQEIGYYMNLQFTPNGCYLADGEGPWKIENSLRIVNAARGHFVYCVFNAGNVREFILDLSAGAAALWDLGHYNSDKFLEDYCREYFGREQSAGIARLYRAYFNSYWCQTKPDIPNFPRQYIFQDGRCARAIEHLLDAMDQPIVPDPLQSEVHYKSGQQFHITPEDSGAQTQIEALIIGTELAATSFQRVANDAEKILPSLSTERQRFFKDNLIVRAAVMSAISSALKEVALAYRDRTDKQPRIRALESATRYLEEARSLLHAVDQGQFEGWYAHEGTFKFKRKFTALANTLALWQSGHMEPTGKR